MPLETDLQMLSMCPRNVNEFLKGMQSTHKVSGKTNHGISACVVCPIHL